MAETEEVCCEHIIMKIMIFMERTVPYVSVYCLNKGVFFLNLIELVWIRLETSY